MKVLFPVFFILPWTSFCIVRAIHTAATGMATQEMNVNTISNNIANVNTTGYKKQRAESEDLLYETIREGSARSSNDTNYNVGIQIGSGSRISSIRREFSQGNPVVTNAPYDLMVNGEGFFSVTDQNGNIFYTRDGSFNVNSEGVLQTKNGYTVIPTVTLPGNTMNLSVSRDGLAQAYIKDQMEPVDLGQIPITTFMNPAGLESVGRNLFRQTASSGNPMNNIAGENNAGNILQGAIESSNVSIMVEMTDLIKAQRAYEMNSKVMSVADQMLQTVNGIR